MRPILNAPAPSSALLKFLRSQSESICFFSPNPRPGFAFDHKAPNGAHIQIPVVNLSQKASARSISTTVPRQATVEAGILNLDFLFPQATTSLRLDPSLTQVPVRQRRRQLRTPSSLRHGSTSGHKWYQRIWGNREVKGGKPLHPDDLPSSLYRREDSGDTSMFSLGRHISAKAAAQPKLRCTELDEHGNIVLTSGEFKKSELIQKVGPSLHSVRY